MNADFDRDADLPAHPKRKRPGEPKFAGPFTRTGIEIENYSVGQAGPW